MCHWEKLAICGGTMLLVLPFFMLSNPARLFLLNEPISVLDLRHQLEVMQTLQGITAHRKAVTVAAMHDLNLAARLGHHIVLMKDGRIVASGPGRHL